MNVILNNILNDLRHQDLSSSFNNKIYINEIALNWISGNRSDAEKEELDTLMRICNIIYGNTDSKLMIVEDGVYDLLQEEYKSYFPDNYQVGTEVIPFKNMDQFVNNIEQKVNPISFYTDDEIDKLDKMFYREDLIESDYKLSPNDLKINPIKFENDISKRQHTKPLEHPDLVGTLDKCKFVLMKDAIEKGVENEPNVKVLERDFFGQHIMQGIIKPDQKLVMVLELKYDGVSVEATCTNQVIDAGSRGDTGIGVASDMTPILEGYDFPNVPPEIFNEPLGLKFEAIMTYMNLWKFNKDKGKDYKNGRSAIVGLFGSGDAWKYRDYITLVPLQLQRLPGMDDDRIVEIEFINKYFAKGEKLRYAVVYGTYVELLYQIDLFRKEAEFARGFLPFMYDGIVVSYLDKDIRKALGRKNFVNKYSMAVKFNPLKKQTEFIGYTYTVGQDGSITPMIHYNPVEFYGTIHPKSTGHSYARFKELNLIKGDILDIEYTNDVMPYVKKADIDVNTKRAEDFKPEKFIEFCPECGQPLFVKQKNKNDIKLIAFEDVCDKPNDFKTVYCINKQCSGRKLSRVVNMLAKLNFQDFAEERIKTLNLYSFKELMEVDIDTLKILGDTNADKFKIQIDKLHNDQVFDYVLLGSLGFTNIGKEKWKLICNKYTIEDLIYGSTLDEIQEHLRKILTGIKGIGPVAIETIVTEMEFFINDIIYMVKNMKNIISTIGRKESKQIRFTGVRDKQLILDLTAKGYDITDGSITKKTDILIVPHEGFTSTKTQNVSPDTIIVSIDDFKTNMNKYL